MITKITPWNNSGQAVEPYSWFCCAGANAFLRVTKSRWAAAEGRWCCPSDASFPELLSLCLSVHTHTPLQLVTGKATRHFSCAMETLSATSLGAQRLRLLQSPTRLCSQSHELPASLCTELSTSLGFCLLALKGKLHLGHQGKAEGLCTKTVLPDLKIYIFNSILYDIYTFFTGVKGLSTLTNHLLIDKDTL